MYDTNNKINLTDFIFIGLLIFNIIVIFWGKLIHFSDLTQYLNYCSILIVISIGSPINDYIKRGILKNKFIIGSLIFRLGLIVILSISFYQIYISDDINLKYTYWFCLISFILIIVLFAIETLISEYRKKRLVKSKVSFGIHTLLFIVLLCLSIFIAIQSFIHPQKQLNLSDISDFQKITIYQNDLDEYGVSFYDLNNSITISDQNDLKKIITEIKSLKTVHSLTTTELLNYEKMKDLNYPYYDMLLKLSDASTSDNNEFSTSGIIYLVATSNRTIVLQVLSHKDGYFWGKSYNEIYPLNLSEETVDMIFQYLD